MPAGVPQREEVDPLVLMGTSMTKCDQRVNMLKSAHAKSARTKTPHAVFLCHPTWPPTACLPHPPAAACFCNCPLAWPAPQVAKATDREVRALAKVALELDHARRNQQAALQGVAEAERNLERWAGGGGGGR